MRTGPSDPRPMYFIWLVWAFFFALVIYGMPAQSAPLKWAPPDMISPMHILINLGVGGEWAGPVNPAITSAAIVVDHVRAYALV